MKILIGLLEHLGDIVACEPVARYLRARHPGATLSWAVREPYRALIDANPNIDETIVLTCITDWIRFSRHTVFDLVVDLHVNYLMCRQCRVPLVKDTGHPFISTYEWYDYGPLLESFSIGAGLPRLVAQPQVYIGPEKRSAIDRLNLPAEFCVVHRQATSSEREWDDRRWNALLAMLTAEAGYTLVEVGSAAPEGTADAALSESDGSRVINLRGRTTILETAEVIRRAALFVGIDSGPAHLANAVQTPGLLLLGQIGMFRQYLPYTGFYGSDAPQVRIVRNLTGPVAELPLEPVLEAARYLIGRLSLPQPAASSTDPTPLVLTKDERRLIAESGYFDAAWYLTHYPDAADAGVAPLQFYLATGMARGDSPGPAFDSRWYRSQRPDLAQNRIALLHYLLYGRKEGLQAIQPAPAHRSQTTATTATAISTTEDRPAAPDPATELPRLFAFYLPQFYPIPENDMGHRPGFTEWDNVLKAKPLFPGHYQPRQPGELGYYDLRATDVMRRQVELAQGYGIAGFCFYYYYFQGRKLLYKPIENYLKSDLDAPFLFLWANENWSRRWNGGDWDVIVGQQHSPEDDVLFIRELLPTFNDRRYVKIDGKPVLGIYRTDLFPDMRAATDRWREEAERSGLPGLYLVMVDQASDSITVHPRLFGFDASYELPTAIIPPNVRRPHFRRRQRAPEFTGEFIDYQRFARYHQGRPFPDYRRFRTVMPPWDNTARYGSKAVVHVNTANEAYRDWLAQAMVDTARRYSPEERLVFVHSWNEWCEGTYLEPDGRYGRRYLEQTRAAIGDAQSILDSGLTPRAAELLRGKDEGAFRNLQAVRQQNMRLLQNLERERDRLVRLQRKAANRQSALRRSLRDVAKAQKTSDQQVHKLFAANNEKAAQLQDAELQLERYRRSRSWRLTAPLRGLGKLFFGH